MKRLPKRDLTRMQDRNSDSRGDRSIAIRPLTAGRRSQQVSSGQPHQPPMFDDLPAHVEQGILDMLDHGNPLLPDMIDEVPCWMSLIPLTDAQMIHSPHLGQAQNLAWSRRQALESALSTASQLSRSMEKCMDMAVEAASNEQHRSIPSLEFLYWMLNDIESDRFGLFVRDYFRHIGKGTLKHMGLSILLDTATPSEALLYTVCVNSIAYKFLTTIVATESDESLSRRLQQNALLYRETAKRALKKIPLSTKPSLSLLQAILCGIFLHQGSGDATTGQELAKAACRVCIDIDLHPGAARLRNASEEERYCAIWCYILDRNYAWKLGRRTVLTVEHTGLDLSTLSTSSAALLLTYLDLAKVQDTMIPFLVGSTKEGGDVCRTFNDVGSQLLRNMHRIRRNINQMKLPCASWTGLDPDSEIAALDFAYHSIMTNILHLHQTAPGHAAVDNYLGSARQELLALIKICGSRDAQKAASYLHWTLLYYPITACFALFCNTVTTCDNEDFQILEAVANCLAQIGAMSQPIATMQNLFQQFVALSRCFFSEDNTNISGNECTTRSQFLQPGDDISNSPLFQLPPWIDETLTAPLGQVVGTQGFSALQDTLQCHNDLYPSLSHTQAGLE
ncbi:hypothetical protein BDV23DRAFT_194731 [Aspergillus alliaceus]|uniref:Xylanolytic transcriptional activator regulatory domain-containing protein n=1 Tax=Petromyces alliaceus TaxID=209559 RepID=A0A5N7C4R7_PETAA|nr:hypothetical protein BDV23DRAFT_194731 [Aspergillus alliaceus]